MEGVSTFWYEGTIVGTCNNLTCYALQFTRVHAELDRRCGLVVCDRCSSHRIRLPPEEIIQDPMVDPAHYPLIAMHPQRVCDACIRIPIKEVARGSGRRRGAANPMAMGHMKRSGSSQSLMTECPVCGRDLLGMRKEDQEKHLQACLNTGSPPVCPPRYIGKLELLFSLRSLFRNSSLCWDSV